MANSLTAYRLLGKSGLRVSPLCLGTMTFGREWKWGSSHKESEAILRKYMEFGGNFIDTANYYTNGTSEKILGEALKNHRDEIVLGTKYSLSMRKGDPNAGGNHRKNMVQSVEQSLRRLGTDYIDLYWIHMWDQFTPVEEVMRALDDLVRSGKVLYIGISDMPAWKISQANTLAELRGWSPCIALQIEYSLIERTGERDLIPMAKDMDIGVMPWSPLGAALLTGKYTRKDLEELRKNPSKNIENKNNRPIAKRLTERNVAIAEEIIAIAQEIGVAPSQVALRWILDQPGISSIVIGARTCKQLGENLGCLAVTLEEKHNRRLHQISAIDLGFPHEFLQRKTINELITGGAYITKHR